MNGDDIGTGIGEIVEKRIHRRDHQVDVERLAAVLANGLQNHRSERHVRNEMPIHYVDMDPVRTGCIDGAHLFAEPREVGGQDRRGDQRSGHRPD